MNRTANEIEKQNEKGAVIYHVYRTTEDKDNNREVSINGSVYSVSLISNNKDETIEYLTEKAIEILKRIREGD